jgi:heat shock protein HslJ
VFLALAACDDNPLEPSDITGPTWRLVSLQEAGSAPVIVGDPGLYTVRFADDGSLAVRSDCNSCQGSYALMGSSLDVGLLACTKVFCGDGSLDPRFTAALDAAQMVSVDGNEMRIQAGTVILRFREE